MGNNGQDLKVSQGSQTVLGGARKEKKEIERKPHKLPKKDGPTIGSLRREGKAVTSPA